MCDVPRPDPPPTPIKNCRETRSHERAHTGWHRQGQGLSWQKDTFERAAPTAADPKETLPSKSVVGCSANGSEVGLGASFELRKRRWRPLGTSSDQFRTPKASLETSRDLLKCSLGASPSPHAILNDSCTDSSTPPELLPLLVTPAPGPRYWFRSFPEHRFPPSVSQGLPTRRTRGSADLGGWGGLGAGP